MKSLIGIIIGSVLLTACNNTQNQGEEIITILQTADIHAYLNPHPELFVENDSIVFRNAGGLANIKTLVESLRKENPDGIKKATEDMKQAGFNAVSYISPDTAHEFLTWRRSLYQMAPLLFK